MKDGDAFDVAVIGSGFGDSVAALRLSEKGYRVAVLEAGRRFRPRDYARSSWNLRRFLWFPALGLRGIQRIDLLPDVMVLSGAGVGGGSLVYANTLIEPNDEFFDDPQWRDIADWKSELAPYYDQARRMLGARQAPADTPARFFSRRRSCPRSCRRRPRGQPGRTAVTVSGSGKVMLSNPAPASQPAYSLRV